MIALHEPLTPAFVRKLEQVECRYWMQYYLGKGVFPTYTTILQGGLVCAIPDLNILAMNRALGLGLEPPVDQTTLVELIRFYRRAGSRRFFLQLPPSAVTAEVEQLLLANGFTHRNNWVKLYRSVSAPEVSTNPELSIHRIGPEDADKYGQLIFMSFDWEDSRLASWLASTVGTPGYQHYLVTQSGKAIAAGALFLDGDMASLAFAGTLAPFRGLGAQQLLIKTRLEAAHRAGARFITAETAQPVPGKPVASHQNMIRMGFEQAYLRQNWLCELD